jgi:hypothetical protein
MTAHLNKVHVRDFQRTVKNAIGREMRKAERLILDRHYMHSLDHECGALDRAGYIGL